MIGHVAFSVGTARIRHQTNVRTLLIDTSLIAGTFGIDATTDRTASRIRIAFVARLTRTGGSMILHLAH